MPLLPRALLFLPVLYLSVLSYKPMADWPSSCLLRLQLSLEDVRRALGAAAQPSPQASLAAYFSTNPSSASSGFSSVSSGVSSAAYPSSMQPSLSTLSASRSDYPSALASSACKYSMYM